MKITKVESIPLRLPVVTEACDGTQDNLVIRIHTDEGIVGIGEVDSCPTVVDAIVRAPRSHAIATGLADLLVGENPLDISRLWDKMYKGTHFFGRFGPTIHAMSGIDIALWDIAGKAAGVPVYQLLGGAYRTKLRAYASILFQDTPQATHDLAVKMSGLGFTAAKFGWGPFGFDAALDKELAAAARKGLGEARDLMIDVGCAWDWKTALKREEMLREFRPFWIEEPLDPDDFEGYGKLSARSQTRIAAGEGESGTIALSRLIREGGLDVVQPDIARCGGLTVGMKVAQVAKESGCMVANHSFKSAISIAASMHFLAAIPNYIALEFCMAESPLRQDLTIESFGLDAEGFAEVPSRPGLGVELNMDVVDKYRH